jgi:hypothetical protein
LLEVLEDYSSSKSNNNEEKARVESNKQSINSLSMIFTPDEPKTRLVLPKVRKS